jgi:hypothetical protein
MKCSQSSADVQDVSIRKRQRLNEISDAELVIDLTGSSGKISFNANNRSN